MKHIIKAELQFRTSVMWIPRDSIICNFPASPNKKVLNSALTHSDLIITLYRRSDYHIIKAFINADTDKVTSASIVAKEDNYWNVVWKVELCIINARICVKNINLYMCVCNYIFVFILIY